MKHPRQSATDWLWSRQEGKRGKFTERTSFSTSRFNPIPPSQTVAWNHRRLQNMILVVGPTTPAAIACGATRDGRRRRHLLHLDDDDDDDDDDDSDESEDRDSDSEMNEDDDSQGEQEVGESGNESESDDDDIEQEISSRREEPQRSLEPASSSSQPAQVNAETLNSDGTRDEDASMFSNTTTSTNNVRAAAATFTVPPASERSWAPQIKHESCINTACWLDVPWRLSLTSQDNIATTIPSWEAPTQLITSGDDHMVKFWDVRHAMGSTSPLEDGWDVFSPFSTALVPRGTTLTSKNVPRHGVPPGAILPLANVTSGHLGNVFHVTPVPSTPGLVLTCGADGQLRKCQVERPQSSNLVMRPQAMGDADSDSDDYFMMPLGMAYSHQLLTDQTGLLCSDRGLYRFDLRLPPREQPRRPFKLVAKKEDGWRSYLSSIKACAVWSPTLGTRAAKEGQLVDSNYVFAGGAGDEVHLFDLRMEASSDESSRVVERYRPRILRNADNVSVCGLDVSKDGRELLVSYESDQIYTFPIFNQASSSAGPTLKEIDEWSERFVQDSDEVVPELASYGAHLNRFTFLKSARYAGPNDDYICTGSDSGHAWIYSKANGTVASLLSADSHVCNGVVPHPSLPIFITYGIDSTAKVWRATLPIEARSSDSNKTRSLVARSRPYQMSPVVKNHVQVQQRCSIFDDASTPMNIYPDYIPTSQEVLCAGRFMPNMLWAMAGGYDGSPRIGNALRTLPYLLRSNRYECCRAVKAEREGPIEGPLESLAHRISRMRLQHQADQMGLIIANDEHPYLWHAPETADLHPADLVPEFPSDWIQWDPAMDQNSSSFCRNVTLAEYPTVELREEAQVEWLLSKSTTEIATKQLSRYPWLQSCGKEQDDDFSWPPGDAEITEETDSEADGPANAFSMEAVEFSRKVLYFTALLCKEGGNEAMKEDMLDEAARRYDKAIQYCAVAFLPCEGGEDHIPHLIEGMSVRVPIGEGPSQKAAYVYTWCPLYRVWISCHLNLALLFLKPGLCKFQGEACNQARMALRLLEPYTKEIGKVYHSSMHLRDEPVETYHEARKLQAKAFFRLGSAEIEIGQYLDACKSLEASIASTDGPVDSAVRKRLNVARSRSSSQKKRNRRRFEVALAGENNKVTASADSYNNDHT